MDKLKTILILIAIILGSLAVLAGISFLYSLLNYVLLFGVIGIGGWIAVRLLSKPGPGPEQIAAPDPKKELQKVQRLLDQYKKQDR